MKPSSGEKDCRKGRRFPVIDCNYQTFSLDRFHGGSSEEPAPSFLNISREYFRYEARRNFLGEAAFFLAFAAILAFTFISGAIVIIHFLNLLEA